MQASQKNIDTSQLTQSDWQRLIDYIDTLVTIDRKLSKTKLATAVAEVKNEH